MDVRFLNGQLLFFLGLSDRSQFRDLFLPFFFLLFLSFSKPFLRWDSFFLVCLFCFGVANAILQPSPTYPFTTQHQATLLNAFLILEMSSMNVNNLIDPLLGQSDLGQAREKETPKPLPPAMVPPLSGLAPAPQLHPLKLFESDTRQSQGLPLHLPLHQGDHPLVPASVIASLLGPEAAVFPMNEMTFREALRLRTEQEKTRQEQIRLEVSTRNLAIMELANRNEVPPHLIPYMVAGDPSDPRAMMSPQQPITYPMVGPQVAQAYMFPQMSPFTGSRQSPAGRSYEHPDNASLVNPINYRFGMGPKLQPETPQRSQSPAKIGAAAVANLTNPVTPYRQTYRTLPTHQRHFSMPSDPGALALRTSDRLSKSKSSNPSRLRSPQGSTSGIQVKPSPAQPLNKQTKNSQIPSQESMTSFQHIIQFHHWKPQNPDDPPLPDKPPGPVPDVPLGQYTMEPVSHSRSGSRSGYSHKRHKSSDMSVDLLSQTTSYNPPIASGTGPSYHLNEAQEEDISMDTSGEVAGDSKPSSGEKKSKSRRVGRPRRAA